jgi:hypothetical protein
MTDKKNPRAGRDGAGARAQHNNDASESKPTRDLARGQAYTTSNLVRAALAVDDDGARVWPKLTPYHFAVLCAYAFLWAEWSTGQGARPSFATVSKRVGCSRRKAIQAVTDLRAWGWLVPTGSLGVKGSVEYNVCIPCTGARGAPVHDVHQCTTCTPPVHDVHPTSAPRAHKRKVVPKTVPKEEKKQHAHTREADIQDSRPAAAPTPDDSKPVHNPFLDDDEDPRPPVVMICEEVEVYVGEQPSHVLAEKMYAELRRRVVAKLKSQGKSSSPVKVIKQWVRHKLLMSSDWAEREGASANRLVRVPAMGTDLEEWMDTRAGYDATTRKSSVPTKSLNQERAEQAARLFGFDDEEVA